MFDLLFFNSRLAKPSQAKPSQAKPSQANNMNSVYYQSSKKICLILFKILYHIKNAYKITKHIILNKFTFTDNKKIIYGLCYEKEFY